MGTDDSPDGGERSGKVTRLLAENDLDGLGAELERRWTASGDERASLRDLADVVNRRLLEARLAEAGVHAIAGQAANYYRLLTDDDVGAGERTRARRRLEREGVDVEQLQADFVSYQAVRTYLTDHRGVDYEPESDPVSQAERTVGRLQSRLASVTDSKLQTARRADAIGLGDYDVTVTVRVDCRDCGRQLSLQTVLAEGGCDCRD